VTGWEVGGRIRKGGTDMVSQIVCAFIPYGGAAVQDIHCPPHAPQSVGGSEMDIGPGAAVIDWRRAMNKGHTGSVLLTHDVRAHAESR
jgi:hypothetical protein